MSSPLYKVHIIYYPFDLQKDPASHSKKHGNKQPINDKTYVKLFECEGGPFFGGIVGQKGPILVVLLCLFILVEMI